MWAGGKHSAAQVGRDDESQETESSHRSFWSPSAFVVNWIAQVRAADVAMLHFPFHQFYRKGSKDQDSRIGALSAVARSFEVELEEET